MESTSERVLDCLKGFRELSRALRELEAARDDGDATQATHLDDMPMTKVEDELRRFKVWAGNIGAHRKGRSSMDYRLRDASHVLRQVTNLLKDLTESLSDATQIVTGVKTPWDQEDDDDDDPCFEDTDSLDLPPDSLPGTELSQISEGLTEIITCLFTLSVSIRNPAPHDRFRNSVQTDTSAFEPFDIEHVRARFPSASAAVSQTLGRANSYRRQYFRYRELHHQKLAHGLDSEGETLAETGGQSTVASSIPLHMKATEGGPRDMRMGALDEDVRSESGVSQTSLATSVDDSGRAKIPPLPAGADNGPFECPFCFTMISASTTVSWKRHVHSDLQPYVCLHDDCPMPYHHFPSRRKWMQHVVQIHTNTSPDDIFSTCPLCADVLRSHNEYERHVGRHQVELALFALPKLPGGDNENEDESASGGLEDSSVGSLQEVRDYLETHQIGTPLMEGEKSSKPGSPVTFGTQESEEFKNPLRHPHSNNVPVPSWADFIERQRLGIDETAPISKELEEEDEAPTMYKPPLRDNHTESEEYEPTNHLAAGVDGQEVKNQDRVSKERHKQLDAEGIAENSSGPPTPPPNGPLAQGQSAPVQGGPGPAPPLDPSSSPKYQPINSQLANNPYIFIPATSVPVKMSNIPHMQTLLKAFRFEDIRLDRSGYFITFSNTTRGREDAENCYLLANGAGLFTYNMTMTLHMPAPESQRIPDNNPVPLDFTKGQFLTPAENRRMKPLDSRGSVRMEDLTTKLVEAESSDGSGLASPRHRTGSSTHIIPDTLSESNFEVSQREGQGSSDEKERGEREAVKTRVVREWARKQFLRGYIEDDARRQEREERIASANRTIYNRGDQPPSPPGEDDTDAGSERGETDRDGHQDRDRSRSEKSHRSSSGGRRGLQNELQPLKESGIPKDEWPANPQTMVDMLNFDENTREEPQYDQIPGMSHNAPEPLDAHQYNASQHTSKTETNEEDQQIRTQSQSQSPQGARDQETGNLGEGDETLSSRDESYRTRLEEQLKLSGLDEQQIKSILEKNDKIRNDRPPTYTRMSRKHLSLETLRAFDIEYSIEEDPDYVLIKRWVPEWEQDKLWQHTLHLRKREPVNVLTVEDVGHDNPDGTDVEWVRKGSRKGKTKLSSVLPHSAGSATSRDDTRQPNSE